MRPGRAALRRGPNSRIQVGMRRGADAFRPGSWKGCGFPFDRWAITGGTLTGRGADHLPMSIWIAVELPAGGVAGGSGFSPNFWTTLPVIRMPSRVITLGASGRRGHGWVFCARLGTRQEDRGDGCGAFSGVMFPLVRRHAPP